MNVELGPYPGASWVVAGAAYHDTSVPVVILYLSPISDCCPVSHIIFQSPQTWNILPSQLPLALTFNIKMISDFVLRLWPLGPFTYKKFTNILQSFIAPRKLKSCSDNDLNYLNKLSLKNLFLLMNAAAYAIINNLCTHLGRIKVSA